MTTTVDGHAPADLTVIALDPSDESPTAQDAPSGELFRLAALRAPLAPTGAAPRIDLPAVPPGTELNGTYVDETGGLLPFAHYAGPDDIYLPMQALSDDLSAAADCMSPDDITVWIAANTSATLDTFLTASEWGGYRDGVHQQLQVRLYGEHAASFTNPRQAVGLLRLTRMIAVLDGIGSTPASVTDADTVHKLLTISHVVLSADSFQAPMDRLSRPPMIADLKVVRLGAARYELGGIANIENVMASETRSRKQQFTDETETTTTISDVSTNEQETDLQTTAQAQLQQEASKAVQQSTSINAGLNISASYGPTVSATLDTRLARTETQDEANKTAATYANQITQQAQQKVTEQISRTVVTRRLVRNRETNLHSFTNTGADAKNINGIYRHVEQVQDAWIDDYGKRLMLEYLVPDPAAMVRWAQSRTTADAAVPEPQPPADPNDATKPLDPGSITPDNYLHLVAASGAASVPAPPEPTIDIAVSCKGDPTVDLFVFQDNTTLKVPTGYQAQTWVAQATLWGRGGPDSSWMVGVGTDEIPTEPPGDGGVLKRKASGVITADSGSVIPVVMLARGFINLAASVRVTCQLTQLNLQAWKLDVYSRIMDAFQQRHQAWADDAAQAKANADALATIVPADPVINLAAERRELRRLVIESLIGTPEDEGEFAGSAVTYPDPDRPLVHQDVLAAERDAVLFFEQAFEWENLTWLHYPYYWADGQRWRDAINTPSGSDPEWAAFLAAGATRVVAPVRPGFEAAMTLYLCTGAIWGGGSVPTVDDPSYLGIAEELAESIDASTPAATSTPLDPVRLPTDLVYLQDSSDLAS